jgi:hypothetical protein
MPVIVVGNEKNFAALRSRLFTGRVSNTTVHEVTTAIEAANPHVDLAALEPGTVLTVPDLPKVSVRGDLSFDETTRQALGGVLETAATTLEQLEAAARTREVEDTAERKQLAKALAAKELPASARKDKAIATLLREAEDGVVAENAAAKDRLAALDEAQAEWGRELEALRKLLPG